MGLYGHKTSLLKKVMQTTVQTSVRDKKLKKLKVLKDSVSTASAPTLNTVPSTSAVVELIPERAPFQGEATVLQRARWWDHFNIHRRVDDYSEGKNEIRQLWKTQKDFFFSCLGFMVGVGNIMRFPAKIYEFGGLGWALIAIAIPVAIYYNIIVAWAIYYFWNSLKEFFQQGPLPWENCLAGWALITSCCNLHDLPSCNLSNHVLSLSNLSDYSLGSPQTHLVICLAVAWILVFIGVCKGIGSIGRTTNITATLPYLLLKILLLRGISLPGANKGLSFLFAIDYDKVSSLKMWRSAATQVFYELGIGAGPLISMAAFSRYRNNIYRDATLLVFM
uniref:Aa_trans domain-containing protein n=1 Tax=Heterorhabditis bacteriophora TaxID=37862 RepID=A0A1I7XSY3_HETBA